MSRFNILSLVICLKYFCIFLLINTIGCAHFNNNSNINSSKKDVESLPNYPSNQGVLRIWITPAERARMPEGTPAYIYEPLKL